MKLQLQADTKAWLATVMAIAACSVHALLFYLRWHQNTGATPGMLMISFWIAVIALLYLLGSIRSHRRRTAVGLLTGILLLAPGATTCVNWTIWSLLAVIR